MTYVIIFHMQKYQTLIGMNASELVLEHSTLSEVTHLRWDRRAPIDLYYNHSRVLLQPVFDDLDSFIDNLNDRNSLFSDML